MNEIIQELLEEIKVANPPVLNSLMATLAHRLNMEKDPAWQKVTKIVISKSDPFSKRKKIFEELGVRE
jgi:hypothetical protein